MSCRFCKDCKYFRELREPLKIQDHIYTGSCQYWNGHSTEPEGFCYRFKE